MGSAAVAGAGGGRDLGGRIPRVAVSRTRLRRGLRDPGPGAPVLRRDQPANFLPGDRTAQVGEDPSGGEDPVPAAVVDVSHQELPGPQAGDGGVGLAPGAPRGSQVEPVQKPRLVPLGGEPAHAPEAGVGQRLVVEIHRVLGGHHQADAEGARLLEQGEHGRLGGRVGGMRREEAPHLIHGHHQAKRPRSGLATHPGDDLPQEEGGEHLPVLLAEVGGVKEGERGLPRRGGEEAVHGERRTLLPGREGRAGQERVQPGHGLAPLLRRIEGVDMEHAQLGERRMDEVAQDLGQARMLPRPPAVLEQVGQEDVGRALERVGVLPGPGEERGDRGGDPLPDDLGLGVPVQVGRIEPGEHVHRKAGVRSRGEEPEVGSLTQAPDAVDSARVPRHALAPAGGGPLGQLGHLDPLPPRLFGVHPGGEVGRSQVRKGQEEVGQISLGIHHHRGDPGQEALLQEPHQETGLPAPGHSHHHAVRGEIGGIDAHRGARIPEGAP